MGNDMSWEQKCRISALRAACASSFYPFSMTDMRENPADEQNDEMLTRILQRAEVFREALLRDGTLDGSTEEGQSYLNDVVKRVEPLPLVNEDTFVATLSDFAVCPGCGASSRGMPLQIGITDGGIPLICNGPWHKS